MAKTGGKKLSRGSRGKKKLNSIEDEETTIRSSSRPTPTEKKAIHKIQEAFSYQEDRLEEINWQISKLLRDAKAFHKENIKEEALKCLRHKNIFEHQLDKTMGTMFNMETQMIKIESAPYDRHIKKLSDEIASINKA